MKTINFVGILLLVATFFAGPLLLSLACLVGEADIFGVGGAMPYTWFIYFGVLVAVASAAFALLMKERGYHYKKNVIVSIVFGAIWLLFGSEGFMLMSSGVFDYTNQIVVSVNQKVGLSIPENEKVVTIKEESYNLANEKIVFGKNGFELSMDDRWRDSLSSSIKNVLPLGASMQISLFDNFLFYDCETKDFNTVTVQEDGHSCVFLAYQKQTGRLLILDDYEYRA